jgi:hypothetical protein
MPGVGFLNQCPQSSQAEGSPTCALAAPVTAPKGLAVRKIRASPVSPVDYFVQQMADFKSGARKFSGPQRSAVLLMTAAAEAATDAEVQARRNIFPR